MRKRIVKLLVAITFALIGIVILLSLTVPGVLSMVIKEAPEKLLLGLDDQLHRRLISIVVFVIVVIIAAISVCFEWHRPDTEQNEVG